MTQIININDDVFRKYTDAETYEKIVDYRNMADMWSNCVSKYCDDIAITDGQPFSFKKLDSLVSSYRGVLVDNGICKGSNVGILLQNGVDFVKAFLAITTYGCTAVLLPPHLNQMAVFGCSMKFALKAVVTNDSFTENCSLLAQKNPGCKILSSDSSSSTIVECEDVSSDSPCAVLFTGGTTGQSKGALLSHGALLRGAKNGCYGYQQVFGHRYFLVLPLTHVFGLVRNLLTSLYTGSNLWICHNNKDMFKEIAVFKPTLLVLVPALAEMALNLSKQFGRNMLGSDVKYIICGAATVAPYLVKEYEKFNISLFPGYGLTESANLVSGNPEAFRKPESVGFIYSGMQAKIVDGELYLKGVNMMNSYVGDPEENARAYDDGWFRTGDLAKVDDEGFLFITGRTKEIIVLPTGENISPAELETQFNALECVQDSLVFEENGSLAVEILPRMVVLKALGVENVGEYVTSQVQSVNKAFPSFQQVSKVIIRDKDFARSPSMKILRNQSR